MKSVDLSLVGRLKTSKTLLERDVALSLPLTLAAVIELLLQHEEKLASVPAPKAALRRWRTLGKYGNAKRGTEVSYLVCVEAQTLAEAETRLAAWIKRQHMENHTFTPLMSEGDETVLRGEEAW